jgi:hypothetical protein
VNVANGVDPASWGQGGGRARQLDHA